MFVKNSVFFIVNKSYLIANILLFREKRLYKRLYLLSLTLLGLWLSKYFSALFCNVCCIILIFKFCWWIWSCFVLKWTFSKYDLFIMVFLKVLVVYGAWSARTTFFFKGACLFKTSRKTFSKGSYSSANSAESILKIAIKIILFKISKIPAWYLPSLLFWKM